MTNGPARRILREICNRRKNSDIRADDPELLDRLDEIGIALEEALIFKGGWREAIVELEDFCSEPVRLKNMLAAADQLDDWAKKARSALFS